ncbi:MAG TPA: hypothetical protein PKB14_18285 [Rubrivivax sp.]|nr:hypothetical protein [Rubrivivax sp.]
MLRAPSLLRDPEIGSASMPLLVGIAGTLERRSLEHYAALVEQMQRRGETATVAALRVMLDEKRRHVDEVARWAAAQGERTAEPGESVRRLLDDVSSAWDEVSGSALLSPYRAFALAVDNEQHAFALYSYLAARATDARVRTQAEWLGIEALRHAAGMRRWRREAWHRERRSGDEAPPAGTVSSIDALHTLLARHEAAIALTHRALAARLREIGDGESASLLESLLETPARPADTRADPPPPIPDSSDPVHLLVAAQKPLESLSETLEAVMSRTEGALFDEAQTALVNVVTRLARIVWRTSRAAQA